MECTRFEELLFERLEGLLDEARCEELTAHARKCLRCGALETMLTRPAEAAATAGTEVPDDLTASILALTSERDPLQRASRQLDLDLPAMASMVPDENFVADVLTATVEADKQRFWYRARAFWHGLAQRPRFALEGAYLGGVAIFLLVGLPGSPLADVPGQVMNQLRNEDGAVRTAFAQGTTRVTELGQTTWSRAGQFATTDFTQALTGADSDLADPLSWLRASARALGDYWIDTFSSALDWLRTAWLNSLGQAPNDSPTTATKDDHDEHPV